MLKGPAGTKRFTATGRTALKGKELQLALGQCSNSSRARFLEKAVEKATTGDMIIVPDANARDLIWIYSP